MSKISGTQCLEYSKCLGIQICGYSNIFWKLEICSYRFVGTQFCVCSKCMGVQILGYSKSMKSEEIVDIQNLWVVKMWEVKMGVFNIMWVSTIYGYSLLWVFKCIGIQICGYSKILWVIKMCVCVCVCE